MSFEERNDFFVERKQLIIKLTKEPINLIFARIKDNDIVAEEFDFMPSNDFRTDNSISRVRIPALLFVKEKVKDESEYPKVFKKYGKQVGTHLFADFEGKLEVIKTYLNEDNQYNISSAKAINEVYPCHTIVGGEHQMCIGLRFTSNLKEGFRSFGRAVDRQSPSGGVYDLTENILDPNRIKSGINSSINRILFQREEHHYAIYVCSGARLVVEDDRFDELTDKGTTKLGVHQNRSLFQLGSLIIFSAELLFEVSIGLTDTVNEQSTVSVDRNTVNKVVFEWKEAHRMGLIKPESDLYQNWFTERSLDECNEQIIFIGHNYSLHNSICWRLKIESPKIQGKTTYARLSAPEGGRIVDIQDWDWGMAEIYWRHRYERLYEKVLFASKPEKYVQRPYFRFKVPDVGGENPLYWQKKIMGVGVNFNSWEIRHKYKYDGKTSTKVGPYFEKYTEMVANITPFPQPLYPPIYSESQYKYLPYKTRPNFKSDQLVGIDGQENKVGYKENETTFLWKDPKRVTLQNIKQLSADHRIGVDLMVYTKDNSVIGKQNFIYFELNSNLKTSSVKKENITEESLKQKESKENIKIMSKESKNLVE